MSASLVGSEMCIRDRVLMEWVHLCPWGESASVAQPAHCLNVSCAASTNCLLYTSDAADDM
eukprot:620809-Alexandrium_andersonii.AAC.1